MEIKEISDTFFANQSFVKIDDAYDLYKKKRYIEYIKRNNKKCIYSQDLDISYLNEMSFIQYLILPKEVENLETLYNLELIGIKLYSSIYNKLDISKLPFLKEIYLICDEKVNLSTLSSVTRLAIRNYKGKMEFKDYKKLEYLEISNSKKLECLESLPKSLQQLVLDYCPSLKKISNLDDLKLKELSIFDCNSIMDIEKIIYSQVELVSIKLFNKETVPKGSLRSLSILNSLKNLQFFITDYKILDYDLKPLKRLLDVDILRWYKKYNLKDSELPHIYVIIKTDNLGYSCKKFYYLLY